jgi:hypothetical protein
MYLVAIAWVYVALMMALAEATSSQGTVLGAIITFVLYGALPISLVMYLMGTPQRRAARRRAEAAAMASQQANDGSHAPAEPLTAEREKP